MGEVNGACERGKSLWGTGTVSRVLPHPHYDCLPAFPYTNSCSDVFLYHITSHQVICNRFTHVELPSMLAAVQDLPPIRLVARRLLPLPCLISMDCTTLSRSAVICMIYVQTQPFLNSVSTSSQGRDWAPVYVRHARVLRSGEIASRTSLCMLTRYT
ncbi:hypothetical protein L226DRAFT_199749 [Lentinus tigrinus ALCF2SS1-7]|uniref:Uncharacterized protein n=1 Tax=Lentinus tigrinus ALCF2SS1-6 TaxID=1328759 RepID=A0A5C2STN7_9APHY|nr:hypothetical protein L227DRAFT_145747 [Lentinus tigrinus ALCF2SS1-6]RPD80400.1 hypothetical protein L226DRAFT_199749 [Lentinus tigrinus ALCF2SS1-7]